MLNLKYLLTYRNFIFLAILFSFIDNFGMDKKSVEKNSDSSFKVVFLGDAAVGKTQIINKFVINNFATEYQPTISATYSSKSISWSNKRIDLQLWDTPGQEKYRKLAKVFYKNSHLIVFVYAIDDKKSFNNIKSWVEDVVSKVDKKTKFLLVGNKCDLEGQRQVSKEDAKQYATENNMEFMEVSAKDGTNIENMFNSSLQKLLEDENKDEINSSENKNVSDNYKKNVSSNSNDNKNINGIYINDLPFCDKYCSCCPCLKKSEGKV